MTSLCFYFFFFFQAEDGIRDRNVTGVQTCALPISARHQLRLMDRQRPRRQSLRHARMHARRAADGARHRSEERRVGKECRARWAPDQEKKKKRRKRIRWKEEKHGQKSKHSEEWTSV